MVGMIGMQYVGCNAIKYNAKLCYTMQYCFISPSICFISRSNLLIVSIASIVSIVPHVRVYPSLNIRVPSRYQINNRKMSCKTSSGGVACEVKYVKKGSSEKGGNKFKC